MKQKNQMKSSLELEFYNLKQTPIPKIFESLCSFVYLSFWSETQKFYDEIREVKFEDIKNHYRRKSIESYLYKDEYDALEIVYPESKFSDLTSTQHQRLAYIFKE